MKPGDLIEDMADNEMGLIMREGPTYSAKEGQVKTMKVWWHSTGILAEIDITALEKGWVRLVSEASVSILHT